MKRGYWIALGLVLVLALGVFAAACGGTEETTTTAGPATTAAPSTDTTAAPSTDTTAAPTTDTTAANTAPVKIGIAISLTGDSAAPCEQIKQGFDTEAKYINANGGINGRQVELVYVDDQSKMDTAVAAIQSLVDQKVDVIIGPFPQWTQPPTCDITEDAGILHIAFGPPTYGRAEHRPDQLDVQLRAGHRSLTAAPTPSSRRCRPTARRTSSPSATRWSSARRP